MTMGFRKLYNTISYNSYKLASATNWVGKQPAKLINARFSEILQSWKGKHSLKHDYLDFTSLTEQIAGFAAYIKSLLGLVGQNAVANSRDKQYGRRYKPVDGDFEEQTTDVFVLLGSTTITSSVRTTTSTSSAGSTPGTSPARIVTRTPSVRTEPRTSEVRTTRTSLARTATRTPSARTVPRIS